jgi:hypothetical protein
MKTILAGLLSIFVAVLGQPAFLPAQNQQPAEPQPQYQRPVDPYAQPPYQQPTEPYPSQPDQPYVQQPGPQPGQTGFIRPNTLMMLRLNTFLSSRTSSVGQPFTARVESPPEYQGAIVRGHVARVQESGRLTGRTEMALAFDSLRLPGGRTVPMRAELTGMRSSESVQVVDAEGNIQSGSRSNQTMIRSGIGAAVGGLLGGLIGGRTGVLVGVLAGGGAGAGSLAIQGARELRLQPGAELEIRTIGAGRQLARAEPGLDPELVSQVQSALNRAGYDAGIADGHMGRRTRSALSNFQRDNGLPVTGSIDPQTAQALGVRY